MWFVKLILIKHTAENLDKWIQVATIECQYYKFIAFDKSTHKLIIIMTTIINWEGMLATVSVPGLLRGIQLHTAWLAIQR